MSGSISYAADAGRSADRVDETGDGQPDQWEHGFPPEVVVRRNPWLSGTVLVLSLLVGAAYLVRALGDGGPWSWVVAALLGAVAVSQALSLLDSRSPLLVADQQGVRLRLGQEWRGLPWSEVRHLVVEPRTSVWHDGRLLVSPRDLDTTLDGVQPPARRSLALARVLYGDPLVVPLGITTRVSTPELVEDLGHLAEGRAHVVELAGLVHGQMVPEEAAPDDSATSDSVPEDSAPEDRDQHDEPDDHEPPAGSSSSPSGSGRHAGRVAEATRGLLRSVPGRLGAWRTAMAHLVSGAPQDPRQETRQETRTDESAAAIDSADMVEDFEPAVVPLIGPRLQAAREAVGLTVDEVSDRTRIRAHVVEAMEAEDFRLCGGDFYARGHLRSLATVLGLDADELVEEYDAAYSSSPSGPDSLAAAGHRVGGAGTRFLRAVGRSIVDTLRGPRWALLAAVALCLVLVWSLARIVVGDQPQAAAPPSMVEQAARLASESAQAAPAQPTATIRVAVPVTVEAEKVQVTVRGAKKAVLWRGTLAPGQSHRVTGPAPLRVRAEQPGLVRVTEAGRARGTVGSGALLVE